MPNSVTRTSDASGHRISFMLAGSPLTSFSLDTAALMVVLPARPVPAVIAVSSFVFWVRQVERWVQQMETWLRALRPTSTVRNVAAAPRQAEERGTWALTFYISDGGGNEATVSGNIAGMGFSARVPKQANLTVTLGPRDAGRLSWEDFKVWVRAHREILVEMGHLPREEKPAYEP